MSNVRICVLDYGSGNVASVRNAFDSLGFEVLISNQTHDIKASTHIALPGVGAFGPAMENIIQEIPLDILELEIAKGKPFLGICVGMQVLANVGLEDGRFDGLSYIPGKVERLPEDGGPIPHIGWNNMNLKFDHPLSKGLDEDSDFYFVHSYAFVAEDPRNVVGTTHYGVDFPAMISKNNVMGVQFHPEKSQKNGLQLLRNFAELS